METRLALLVMFIVHGLHKYPKIEYDFINEVRSFFGTSRTYYLTVVLFIFLFSNISFSQNPEDEIKVYDKAFESEFIHGLPTNWFVINDSILKKEVVNIGIEDEVVEIIIRNQNSNYELYIDEVESRVANDTVFLIGSEIVNGRKKHFYIAFSWIDESQGISLWVINDQKGRRQILCKAIK